MDVIKFLVLIVAIGYAVSFGIHVLIGLLELITKTGAKHGS